MGYKSIWKIQANTRDFKIANYLTTTQPDIAIVNNCCVALDCYTDELLESCGLHTSVPKKRTSTKGGLYSDYGHIVGFWMQTGQKHQATK